MVSPGQRTGLLALAAGLLMAAAAVAVAAGEPPSALLLRLGSESYPERVAAERELHEWALGAGSVAETWLLRQMRDAADPEVRTRSGAVLRAVVLERLTQQRPGFLGIGMRNVEVPERFGGGAGIQVISVSEGHPAAAAGIAEGDVILGLNGKGWAKGREADKEFAARIGGMRAGETVKLRLLRGGVSEELQLRLGVRPFSAGEFGREEDPGAMIFPRQGPFGGLDPEEEARERAFLKWMETRGGDKQAP